MSLVSRKIGGHIGAALRMSRPFLDMSGLLDRTTTSLSSVFGKQFFQYGRT